MQQCFILTWGVSCMILNSSNHSKKHEKMTVTQKFNTLDTDVASYEAGAS